MQETQMPLISIVIPVHNEAENIAPLVDALKKAQKNVALACAWEIIFVDDSTDDTWEHIRAQAPKGVSGIRMARRFGHQEALEAGLRRAKGDAVISMDGDLQHPPELIPTLVSAWQEGYDIVQTRRLSYEKAGMLKQLTSTLFYKVFNKMSETHLESGSVDFRLVSRRALDILNSFPEKQKFYRGLIPWIGLPTAEITFHAPPRLHGTASYSMRRLLALAVRGITSSSTAPMNISLYLGVALTLLGGAATVLLLVGKYALGWDSVSTIIILATFIVFNNGMMLAALGILSLYTATLYREVLHRPNYIIAEEIE